MRLIDADELKAVYIPSEIEGFEKMMVPVEVVLQNIDDTPTVDAVPVKHGRWIYHIDDLFPAESTQECDQCHEEQPLTCGDNFCPNCGADMREVTT